MSVSFFRDLLARARFLLVGGKAPIARIPVSGRLAGKDIETTTDSEAARYYLEDYKENRNTNPDLHSRIDQLRQNTTISDFNRDFFKDLGEAFSPDFASLFFADFMSETEPNKGMQSAFNSTFLDLKKATTNGGAAASPELAASYLLLFMPGWHYKTFRDTGADFAMPRAALSRLGFQAHLIEADENGSIEHNAAIIAEEIIRYSKLGLKIILVGASKSCPEGAMAVGELLKPEQAQCVKALINIGGLLQGSLLANFALDRPLAWFIKPFFFLKGWDTAGLRSMKTDISRERFLRLKIPDHVLVISYVGVPLSGQVSARAKHNFTTLREYGPNDGLTLLTDGCVPGGITLVEPGLDHYFQHPDMDLKAAALAMTVIDYIERKNQSGMETPRCEGS
ncbi:MAG TPA: hypothetical protein VGO68_15300 [Pyrinomonadaceae bacterium]|jgi:hypothetical protein|nr:hypothetical protein [Pyrinomonadaceae bacterium]